MKQGHTILNKTFRLCHVLSRYAAGRGVHEISLDVGCIVVIDHDGAWGIRWHLYAQLSGT
jgi:hypothetical protein